MIKDSILRECLQWNSPPSELGSFEYLEVNEEDGNREFRLLQDDLPEWQQEKIERWIAGPFTNMTSCRQCGRAVQTADACSEHDESDDGPILSRTINVWSCHSCTYWQMHWCEKGEIGDFFGSTVRSERRFFLPKLHEFEKLLPEGVESELLAFLRSHPSYWNKLPKKRFEQLIVDIFRVNYAPCEVIHVGKPLDHGADAFLIDAGRNQWLIQCKCREKEGATEGVETARSVVGALAYHDLSCGIIVSTANHFSFWAEKDFATKVKMNCGYTLRFVDRGKLNRMLTPMLEDRPWLRFAKHIDPDAARHLADRTSSIRQLQFEF